MIRILPMLPWIGWLTVLFQFHPARAGSSEKINVFVSIAPQQNLVERIGDGRVNVSSLVKPGECPESYDPSPRQLVALKSAGLWLHVGIPFEFRLLPKAKQLYPNLKIVDQRQSVALLTPAGEPFVQKERPGSLASADHHIWLDPKRLVFQTKTISQALCQVDPTGCLHYQEKQAGLQKELEALDLEIERQLRSVRGKTILVYHPAYTYFLDSYGLRQLAIEKDGKEPSAKQLQQRLQKAKQLGLRQAFVQPDTPKKSAKLLAQAIRGKTIMIDPLAFDVLANLKFLSLRILESFEP